MTNNQTAITDNEHDWFKSATAAYLADGLSAAERARFDTHREACASCATTFGQAAAIDERLGRMFDGVMPPALEEKVINRLRLTAPRRRLHPLVLRSATGVAAAVLLGGLGYVSTKMIGGDVQRQFAQLPWESSSRPANQIKAILQGDRNIATLVQNSRELADQGRYREALDIIDQILALDSKNDYALGVRQLVEDHAILQEQRGHQADFPHQFILARNASEEKKIPYDDILRYPANWPDLRADVDGDGIADAKTGDTSVNHGKDGQTVLYGDGHVELQQNPFTGGNRDDITYFGGAVRTQNAAVDSPFNATGLSLQSTDDKEGGYGAHSRGAAGMPADHGKLGLNGGALSLNGTNAYTGVTSITGGTLSLGTDAADGYNARSHRADLAFKAPAQPEYFGPGSAILASRLGEDPNHSENGKKLDYQDHKMAPADADMGRSDVSGLGKGDAAKSVPADSHAVTPSPETATPSPAVTVRKVIRNGEMEFEVDGFDDAADKIGRIVAEEGGYVSTTDSEKLPNGKVRGTVTVRVPPDHLDTLVLKLRALGDLKGQKITAQDVTKQYTDLESELRAARAMEERLLDIIKNGKGEVKDLLEAEKQLGEWREKIEQVTGEINYYNNLVSLSTLAITLTEKDIRTPAAAAETETVNAGLEADDVEAARAEVLKTIDAAKGRIIQSDLKAYEAGQLAATVVAELPPDAAGPLIDRLRQLGHLARLDMQRQTTTTNGDITNPTLTPAGGVAAPLHVVRQATVLNLSIYNLANVAPRTTDNLSIACTDVEAAYHTIIDRVAKAGGRVVNSSLNRPRPDAEAATLTFEIKSPDADAVLVDVRAAGEVMQMTVTENPDAANVTAAKRGFAVQLVSIGSVLPRDVIERTILPGKSVADAYAALLAAAQNAGGRIIVANQEQARRSDVAYLDFEVPRDKTDAIEQSVSASGSIVSRKVTHSADTENTVDSKVQYKFQFVDLDALAPRQTVQRTLAVGDVPKSYDAILAAAQAADARIMTAQLNQQDQRNVTGVLEFQVRQDRLPAIEQAAVDGKVWSESVARSADTDNTTDAKVQIYLTLGDARQMPPRQTTTLGVEVNDPEKSATDLTNAVVAAGGQALDPQVSKTPDGRVVVHLILNLPLARGAGLVADVESQGKVREKETALNARVPDGGLARARIDLTLASEGAIVGADAGLGASLKSAVGTSIRGLLWSLQLLVVGLCLAGPWIGLIWVGWKLFHRRKKTVLATV